RLRRAALPPVPDELAWLSKLGARLGVDLSPHASQVFAEVSSTCYGGVTFDELGEQTTLPARVAPTLVSVPAAEPRRTVGGGPIQLVRYRPLFSGPAVERTPELQYQ